MDAWKHIFAMRCLTELYLTRLTPSDPINFTMCMLHRHFYSASLACRNGGDWTCTIVEIIISVLLCFN